MVVFHMAEAIQKETKIFFKKPVLSINSTQWAQFVKMNKYQMPLEIEKFW